jgi:hypothetical protein
MRRSADRKKPQKGRKHNGSEIGQRLPVRLAVLISAGVVLAIIGVRLALAGVIGPAVAILAVTLAAANWPSLQGIPLTAEGLAFFIVGR